MCDKSFTPTYKLKAFQWQWVVSPRDWAFWPPWAPPPGRWVLMWSGAALQVSMQVSRNIRRWCLSLTRPQRCRVILITVRKR